MIFNPPTAHGLTIPFLTTLHLEAELVRCDQLLCVLLADDAGHFYLAHFSGLTTESDETWLVVPVHRDSIPRLLTGQIPLRTAFEGTPEVHRLVGRVCSRDATAFRFRDFYPTPDLRVFEGVLPNQSFRFFADEFDAFLHEELEPVSAYARRRLAEVLYVRLFGAGMHPSLFPLSLLSELGSALQRLITNLSLFRADPQGFGRRGPGRLPVELGSQFALTAVAGGSVQLRIEALQQAALIQELAPAYSGLEAFADLTGTVDAPHMCTLLTEFPPRIRANFLAYASAVQKTHGGIQIQWGTPRQTTVRESLWKPEVVADVVTHVSRMTVAEENEFEATGIFTEGSMTTRRFRFLDVATNRQVTGHIAPEVEQDIVSLSRERDVAVLYNVVIREVVSTTAVGTTSYEYTFLHIEQA